MGKLYVVKGMGRGFDGLIVEEGQMQTHPDVHVVGISRIINHNAIFGDRHVSFPVKDGCLFIDRGHLEPFDEELREYDSKNPNGAYLSETRFRRISLEAVLVEYERSLTVTVLEHMDGNTHTRYTQNYLRDFDVVRAAVDLEVKKGDLEDLIFTLTELKEQELTTNG